MKGGGIASGIIKCGAASVPFQCIQPASCPIPNNYAVKICTECNCTQPDQARTDVELALQFTLASHELISTLLQFVHAQLATLPTIVRLDQLIPMILMNGFRHRSAALRRFPGVPRGRRGDTGFIFDRHRGARSPQSARLLPTWTGKTSG